MKKFFYIVSLLVCFGFVSHANATQLQYNFTGNVLQIEGYDDVNNSLYLKNVIADSVNFGDTIFTVGESMEYQFLVDFSAPGQCSSASFYVVNGVDCSSAPLISEASGDSFDYFYSELLSASNSTSWTWLDINLNYGLSKTGLPGRIFGESSIWIEGAGFVNSWVIDDPTDGLDYLFAGYDRWETTEAYGQVTSRLRLTDIRAVSEPATFFLIALGLLLAGFSRKQQTKFV